MPILQSVCVLCDYEAHSPEYYKHTVLKELVMMSNLYLLTEEMICYYSGDPRRIQHFIKVHGFAKMIGKMEHIDSFDLEVLEAAAILHDVGIKSAEMKYGRCDGKLQEQEGPPIARKMLESLSFDKRLIDRVCFLVGNHHTYSNISGSDYQILVEADFLVNMHEENSSRDAIRKAYRTIFKTPYSQFLCRKIFDIEE